MRAGRLSLIGALLLAGALTPTAAAQLPGDLDPPGFDSVEAASQHDVDVVDNAFEPQVFETEAGVTVMWEQTGENPHSVTSEDDGAAFDSNPNCSFTSTDQCMSQGDTFSHTFDDPGTYEYFCRIHQDVGMTGTVEVSASGDTTTTTGAPATTTTVAGTEVADETETDADTGAAQALPATGPQAALALVGTGLLTAAAALRRLGRE